LSRKVCFLNLDDYRDSFTPPAWVEFFENKRNL